MVDDKDYELVSKFKWFAAKDSAGNFYVRHNSHIGMLDGKPVSSIMYMHNLIMRPKKGFLVDHKNHNPLDNTRNNMRSCSAAQNSMNRRKSNIKKYSSRFKGVHFDRRDKKWIAQIEVNGIGIRPYSGNDELEAAKAYNDAAIKYFGKFAVLNTT